MGHGYLQHVENEWGESRWLCYHSHLIHENQGLPDGIAFACRDSIHNVFRADTLFVTSLGDRGEQGVDIEDSKNESSERTDENNWKRSGLNLETGRISEDEQKQAEKK